MTRNETQSQLCLHIPVGEKHKTNCNRGQRRQWWHTDRAVTASRMQDCKGSEGVRHKQGQGAEAGHRVGPAAG